MAVLRALFVVLAVSACVQVIVSVDNHSPVGHQGGQNLNELIGQVFKVD